MIDSNLSRIDYKRFYYALSIIKTNKKINIIISFIIFYMYNLHDKRILNGFSKKSLFLLIIDALSYNTYANIEYHLHLIIDICLKFMTSDSISLNDSDQEGEFRQNSGLMLSKLVNR